MDDLQRQRLKATSTVGDATTQQARPARGHPLLDPWPLRSLEEVFRLGMPRDRTDFIALPLAVAASCAVDLRSLNIVVQDATNLVDQVVAQGPDDPYWFDSEIDPKSDRIRRVEQTVRTLRGVYLEIVDVLIDSDSEFPGCAPDGAATHKLLEIHGRSRDKAVVIVKFIVEFMYMTLQHLPPSA